MIPFQRICILLILLSAILWTASAVAQQVQLVDAVPAFFSNEAHSDSEPGLTVDPANPSHIVLTAFTPCPPLISTTHAPIYYSMDGGNTWQLNCIVPGNDPIFGTGDITVSFASSGGVLYAGDLRGGAGLTLNILRTGDFTSPNPMSLLVSRALEDQPYTQAASAAGADRVFLGNNNLVNSVFFGGLTGKTASVDVSLNAATMPPPAGFGTSIIEPRSTCGQDLPSTRPTIHPSGTIYAAYFRNGPGSGCFAGSNTVDVIVARDDNWGTGGFASLVDPGDGHAGVRVDTNKIVVWFANLGTQRIGTQISVAVDPNDKRIVYVAWADGASAANYTLHVRRSVDSGVTWSADLKTVMPATNPALAINTQGKVGFLYQKFVNSGTCQGASAGSGCWETHFERYDGTSWTDLPHPLANVPDNAGSFSLGDYDHVLAVGKDFYGVFSANNYPDSQNFYPGVQYQRYVDWPSHTLFADAGHTSTVVPSVDPFFFHVKENGATNFKRWVGSLHLGATLPQNNLNSFGASFSLGADLEYRLSTMYSLETYLGYDRFSSSLAGVPDFWFVSLSERFKATFSTGNIRPFVFLGLGPYFAQSGGTHLGINTGGGLQDWLTPKFAIESSYTFHTVFTPLNNTRYSTLLSGVRFTW